MYRPAYLAGQWYPDTEKACAEAIDDHAEGAVPEPGNWRGIIAPHAGWTYSGRAAARTFRWLAESAKNVDLAVVFGAHRGPEGPSTVFRATFWETPMGLLPNAQPLADRIALELRLKDEPATPLRPDNAAELQMPFVKHFWPDAEILMLGVESSERAIEIGKHVGKIAKEAKRNAVFIGSTDLTHYGPNYCFEPMGRGPGAVDWVRKDNDKGFINKVLGFDLPGLIEHGESQASACCPGAVAASMSAACSYGRKKETALVEHYLSYDILANPSFVGYAGLVF